MAIIRKPYDQAIQDFGATHRWPLTGPDSNTLADDVLDGPGSDITLSPDGNVLYQDSLLFSGDVKETAAFEGNLDIGGIPAHVTNQNIDGWTMISFLGPIPTEEWMTWMYVSGTDYRTQQQFNESTLVAFQYDPVAGEIRTIVGGLIVKVASGTTADISSNFSLGGMFDAQLLGEVAFFPKVLTLDELETIHAQRRFLGKIAGTVTVNGEGEAVTLRGYLRENGVGVGETVTNADGTYELWVTEPAGTDVFAFPPDGVAGRPVAHGPFEPVDQN